MPTCPTKHSVKDGRIHNGKQRFLCRSCGRQVVEHSTKKVIDAETRALVGRLLLERILMAEIARVAQVSEQWFQDYVNARRLRPPVQSKSTPRKRPLKVQYTVQCQDSEVRHDGLWCGPLLTVRKTSSGSGLL